MIVQLFVRIPSLILRYMLLHLDCKSVLEKFTEVWIEKNKKPYIHVNIWARGGVIYN